MEYGLPLSGTTTAETLLPTAAEIMKSDYSSLTTAYNINMSRKRSRDHEYNYSMINPFDQKNCSSFSFLGEDLSIPIEQQQSDINCLISHHMEKVRMEIESKRRRQARMVMEAIEIGMRKRMRAKEEEIEKMGKLNFALEEKVRTLCIENQLWRELAQSNEATANVLRANLEHVLDWQFGGPHTDPAAPTALADDTQSSCGSNDEKEYYRSSSNGNKNYYDNENIMTTNTTRRRKHVFSGEDMTNKRSSSSTRCCINCWKEESCVLLLPCRHLCLCTACGSSLHSCPICKSINNGSVHVNLSS